MISWKSLQSWKTLQSKHCYLDDHTTPHCAAATVCTKALTTSSRLKSFLSNRTFSLTIVSCTSSVADISCGEHNISFLSYADDTQLYLPLKWNDLNSCETFRNCLKDIKSWMSHSFLQLNESKTEMVIFGNSNMKNHFVDYLHDFSSNIKPSA